MQSDQNERPGCPRAHRVHGPLNYCPDCPDDASCELPGRFATSMPETGKPEQVLQADRDDWEKYGPMIFHCEITGPEVLAIVRAAGAADMQSMTYKSFTDGMEAAAQICGSLAETTYDDTDAFEAATGCEASIMRVVKAQRKEQAAPIAAMEP